MKCAVYALASLLLLAYPCAADAASGIPDPTFSCRGCSGGFSSDLRLETTSSILAQPNGRILVGSRTNTRQLLIGALRRNGKIDRRYANQGLARLNLPSDPFPEYAKVYPTKLLSVDNGAIIVAGTICRSARQDDQCHPFVARVLDSGALDPAFGKKASGVRILRQVKHGTVTGIATDSNGRILLAIDRLSRAAYEGVYGVIACVRANGELDTTFGPNRNGYFVGKPASFPGLATDYVGSRFGGIASTPEGTFFVRLVLEKEPMSSSYGGFGLMKLSRDGVLDTSFASIGWILRWTYYEAFDASASYRDLRYRIGAGIALSAAGTVVVAATSLYYTDGVSRVAILRWFADQSSVVAEEEFPLKSEFDMQTLAADQNGRPYLVGLVNPNVNSSIGVMRLLPETPGLDPSFGGEGWTIVSDRIGQFGTDGAVSFQSDLRLLLSATAFRGSEDDRGLIRFLVD